MAKEAREEVREALEELRQLNLMDKFLFDETMEEKEAYQAMVELLLGNEVELLEPGVTDFNQLSDSCFILIAPFDLFGKGLYRYTFEGVCRECPELKREDGSLKVFINIKGKNREDFPEEFLDFMEYIVKTTDEVAERTKSLRIKRIHERVRKVRQSE